MMDRRGFFKNAGRSLLESGMELIDKKLENQARKWIRPPFAIKELDFILSCTRCGACIAACPESILFELPVHLGAKAAKTPAMDLTFGACRLCDDWPCVSACEPQVLKKESTAGLPQLSRVSIREDICLPYLGPECGACFGVCPVPGALTQTLGRPQITDDCCGCGQCRQACISDPKAIEVQSIYNKNSNQEEKI